MSSRTLNLATPMLGGLAMLGLTLGLAGACIPEAILLTADGGAGGSASTSTNVGANGGTGPMTGSGGTSTTCTTPQDCPGGDTTCRFRTCMDGVCGFENAMEGALCSDDGGQLCNDSGECVECLIDDHCTGGDQCIEQVCSAGLDNGQPCMDNADCASGFCPQPESVCCDTACDQPCESCLGINACNQSDGVCRPVTAGTDPDMDCAQGACFGGSCQQGTLAFVTSQVYNGNLGGLAGADMLCQMHASTACLPGTYKAWLGTTTDTPATTFSQSLVPYRLTDGTEIAGNWADLTDANIDAPLNLDEYGMPSPTHAQMVCNCSQYSFSAVQPAGNTVDTMSDRCGEWTNTTGTPAWGCNTDIDFGWTYDCYGTTAGSCQATASLYCFQQP